MNRNENDLHDNTSFSNNNRWKKLKLCWHLSIIGLSFKYLYKLICSFSLVLCWSKPPITWFEAQTLCRNKNQSLSLKTNESTDFYWTGFHRKTSHWIKIIGSVLPQNMHMFAFLNRSLEMIHFSFLKNTVFNKCISILIQCFTRYLTKMMYYM